MKIGVVGTRGGWSSELLADTVAAKTGFRLLVDMEQVCMDLDAGTVWTEGVDLVPHTAKPREVRAVLNNSFGFGGTNASLVLKKVD